MAGTQAEDLSFIHPLVQLEKLLMEKEGLDLINALFHVMQVNDQDELATSLVLIFGHNEADFTLLKWALAHEIASTDAEGTLFRGAHLAQKLVSVYCRNWGLVYLFHMLDPTIEEICCGADLELDPSRVAPDGDLKRNQARFVKLIGRLMKDITTSAPQCPIAMKLIYDYIQEETVKRFPNMRYKVIGGFFFLRFVCPALSTPEAFDLRTTGSGSALTKPTVRRSLVLLSKFLQNLGSDLPFGDKEEWMTPMNDCLKQHRDSLHKFFDELVQIPAEVDDIPPNPLLTEELCVSALTQIRKWLIALMPAIKQHLDSPIILVVIDNNTIRSKKLLPALTPTLTKLESVLALPFHENSGDSALVHSHRELMRSGLQKDLKAHEAEIEQARQQRRLIRKESNLNYVKELQTRKAATVTGTGTGTAPASPGKPRGSGLSNLARQALSSSDKDKDKHERERQEKEKKELEDSKKREKEKEKERERQEKEKKRAEKGASGGDIRNFLRMIGKGLHSEHSSP